MFYSPIDFKFCLKEIVCALQEFCYRCCKCWHIESNAFNVCILNIFNIIDGRISFYCINLDFRLPKP